MNKIRILFVATSMLIHGMHAQPNTINSPDWIIVGAGPAGITTVGILLDIGTPANSITWLDPEFSVGRLSLYPSVPANTTNRLFLDFLEHCKTFQECQCPSIDALKKLELDKGHALQTMIEPLQCITNHLCKKVNVVKGTMKTLYLDENYWHISTDNNQHLQASHVVLATGSYPKTLVLDTQAAEISLEVALDKHQLAQAIKSDDIVAVFGSSHSAILALKYLSELSVKKIINFYNNPLRYTVNMGNWYLNISSGLKGVTAAWAKEVLEKNPPANLLRLENTEENINRYLPTCTKVIHAVGFEPNKLPTMDGSSITHYNDTNGTIAPRLFGIGIAFPEKYIDPLGNVEYRIGVNSFIDYAQRLIPQWAATRNAQITTLHYSENLLVINAL